MACNKWNNQLYVTVDHQQQSQGSIFQNWDLQYNIIWHYRHYVGIMYKAE